MRPRSLQARWRPRRRYRRRRCRRRPLRILRVAAWPAGRVVQTFSPPPPPTPRVRARERCAFRPRRGPPLCAEALAARQRPPPRARPASAPNTGSALLLRALARPRADEAVRAAPVARGRRTDSRGAAGTGRREPHQPARAASPAGKRRGTVRGGRRAARRSPLRKPAAGSAAEARSPRTQAARAAAGVPGRATREGLPTCSESGFAAAQSASRV